MYVVYQSGNQLACGSTPKACQHKLTGNQGQAKLSAANACQCHANAKACHAAHLDHDRQVGLHKRLHELLITQVILMPNWDGLLRLLAGCRMLKSFVWQITVNICT